jgi:ferredoxin
MSIKIDASKCIGCGACVSACPKCFEMDGAVSKVKDENCVCDDCDIKEIAEACPGGAISVD